MKTATTTLLIALGLASSAVVAQTQSSPGAGGVQTDSQAGQQSQYNIGPSGLQPVPQPGAPGGAGVTSGASSAAPSGSSGTLGPQSGAQSGMPPHPSSGTSGTQSAMPPPGTDTSGAQPGTPPSTAPDTSGAAGTSGTTGAQPDMPPLPGSAEDKAHQPTSGASATPSSSGQGGAEPSPVARLQPKTENGVTYVCGGVGAEERNVMKREAKKHDVLLTFADKKGELMTDVNVAIKDTKGNTVLETTCDGPMMLVDLPQEGKYRVHAEANGYVQTVAVTKAPGKKAQQTAALVLTWPDRVAELEGPVETATGGSGTGGTGAAGGEGKGNR